MTESLYAQYLRERTEDFIIEDAEGFATWRYLEHGGVPSCYIVDIYVVPAARKSGVAGAMADIIASEARARGFQQLIGTVDPGAKGATASLKVLLAYGMTLSSAAPGAIILTKPLLPLPSATPIGG